MTFLKMKLLLLLPLCLLFNIVALEAYPEYHPYPKQQIKPTGAYKGFLSKVDKKQVKVVFEIGSRDALDAIYLSQRFKTHVHAFECNPDALEIAVKNIGKNPNITLAPYAVWVETGKLLFYRVPEGNIGASSVFPFNPDAKNYPDILEEGLTQEEIIVDAIRLDEYLKLNDIPSIDLLCMDVQGAAFEVLQSLGDYLSEVKYIITELETHPIYLGEVLYEDVDAYLKENGFERTSSPLNPNGLFGDVLYTNKHLIKRDLN